MARRCAHVAGLLLAALALTSCVSGAEVSSGDSRLGQAQGDGILAEAVARTAPGAALQAFDPVEWVSAGGWLVELLLPRTDAGVAVQAAVVMVVLLLLLVPARRAGVLALWLGSAMFVAGLFVLRGAH